MNKKIFAPDLSPLSFSLGFYLNILDILAIVFILISTLFFQFILKDMPCPLCLLQRLGLFFISFGFLANLKFDIHPKHYACSLLAALFTAVISGRQILLHIIPGSGSYGQPFLGLHLYTWSFIISFCFLVWITLLLMFERQFAPSTTQPSKFMLGLANLMFALVMILIVFNIIYVYLHCGLGACPEN